MEKAGKLKRIPFADRAADEEAGRSGDGRLREGNRRHGDLQQDQFHVGPATQGRRKTNFLRRSFFVARRPCRGRRMRKFIDGYYRLLNVLLGASVGILIVPVTLQMIARFTALIPAWIWTEEMARFLFIWMVMLGAMIGVRDGTHFDVDVWPELKPRANALLRIVSDRLRAGVRAGVRLVRHQVRPVRLEPDLRARRPADGVHLRRVAADRRSPGCCSAASGSWPTCASWPRRETTRRAMAAGQPDGRAVTARGRAADTPHGRCEAGTADGRL